MANLAIVATRSNLLGMQLRLVLFRLASHRRRASPSGLDGLWTITERYDKGVAMTIWTTSILWGILAAVVTYVACWGGGTDSSTSGILGIVVGVLIAGISIRGRTLIERERNKPKPPEPVICPECGELFQGDLCPKCGNTPPFPIKPESELPQHARWPWYSP